MGGRLKLFIQLRSDDEWNLISFYYFPLLFKCIGDPSILELNNYDSSNLEEPIGSDSSESSRGLLTLRNLSFDFPNPICYSRLNMWRRRMGY
ncbi:hypothetical protein M6B38_417670 [Iris pallida]|uniref:Uncharacterized protein n=1 Tax=Iris pallida TaxID=29817 RepID=A0AAX6FIK3_IRIPA|nr:hypothetical protein M6B38_417670 [Iris pallida]